VSELFVQRLTVLDFSYLDVERGLVGESWQADIVLQGDLDAQGMVLDFGDVKKITKKLIDEQFDHKLLVPESSPAFQQASECLTFTLNNGKKIIHCAPDDAVTLIHADTITPETVSRQIIDTLMPLMPSNVLSIQIHLWPEKNSGAFYHYSHGLKLHCGNCQRIAHGHRSRIEILRNGERDNELEAHWATRWRDIYIGTREDLIDETDGDYRFAYTSAQGAFALQLPKTDCYLIDTESTVENIAQHLADALKHEHPEDDFQVRAFEGVDKGAIGRA